MAIPTQLAIRKMGEEIGTSGFTRDDFAQFADRLAEETEIVRRLFSSNSFSREEHTLGFEIECWILDHNYFPASINQQLLETLAHPLIVPELSRFNVELNCEPLVLLGDVFGRAEKALSQLWTKCNDVAHTLDANMVLIGTLPTIRDEDLSLANMSPLNRFYALNREVMRQRSGHAVCVDIQGSDHLISTHRDVMLEAATTSFQIHLKAPMDLANRYYNASVAISGPVLAACGNAPILFGKCLWEETRIPLFEQAVAVSGASKATRRVSMGSGYLIRSCFFPKSNMPVRAWPAAEIALAADADAISRAEAPAHPSFLSSSAARYLATARFCRCFSVQSSSSGALP